MGLQFRLCGNASGSVFPGDYSPLRVFPSLLRRTEEDIALDDLSADMFPVFGRPLSHFHANNDDPSAGIFIL